MYRITAEEQDVMEGSVKEKQILEILEPTRN